MFPGEGSIYLWTHKAFGPFWGFFAGFCAWWPGVLVMVATGVVSITFLGFLFPGSVGSWSIQVQGLLIIGFILLSAVLAVLRFRVTQNIVNVVFVLYGLGIVLMLLAGIVHLAGGHPAATDPTDFAAWKPSADTGINFSNWKIAYGAWFWWVGGIALASMVVGALLYLLGRRTDASARRGDALPAAGSGG
jgi:amino acid transporter